MKKDPTKKDPVAANIQKVKSEISDAEAELQKLIGAIQTLRRAEKVTVSKVVGEAFEKLRSANARLGDLEKRLKERAKG